MFTCSSRMSLSMPFMMKYPPCSSESSLFATSCAGVNFSMWHLFDYTRSLVSTTRPSITIRGPSKPTLTMIGTFP